MERFNAHEAIDQYILGNDAKNWKHDYISDSAVPYCDIEGKRICSPVMPTIIDVAKDKIIRGKNEHEAGHARLTPNGKNPAWSALKGQLVNVLEDLRIEKGIKALSNAFESDIDTMNGEVIAKLQTRFQTGGFMGIKPINEALMALHFNGNGYPAQWNVSPMAREYYDGAVDIFNEWRDADCHSKAGFAKIEEIADRILAIWESVKQNQQNQQNQGNGNSNGNSGAEDAEDSDNGESSDANGDDNANGNSNGNSDAEDGDANDAEDANGNESNDNANDENNGKVKNKKFKNPVGGGKKALEDDFEDNDYEADAIKEELEKIFEESKSVFGDYTPYTDEDVVIRADENKCNFDEAFRSASGATSALSSYLEQSLKSLSRSRTIQHRDKGNLNVRRNVVNIAKSLSKNIFEQTTKGISLDTSVTILIDESGSIGGRTSREFRKIVVAFAEVLERLKIKFEVLGHTTDYCCYKLNCDDFSKFTRILPIKIYEHKNFNERYQSEKYRLGSISYENCNIDGEALLYAYKRNMEQRSTRHVILVFSDGLPNDCFMSSNTTVYKNLSDTINFCRKNGAEIYAFGIGTEAPEKFYGKDNFIYLASVDEMTNAFFRKTAEIIAK